MRKISVLFILLLLVKSLAFTGAQSPVEITLLHTYPDDRDIHRITLQELADEYMAQHPEVTITLRGSTEKGREAFDEAMRAAEQGDAPTILHLEDSLTQLAIDSGFFVKMSDYATDEQKASIADILEPIRAYYGMTDNDFWGMPWNAASPILYYNPDIFAAAGVESPPRTFAEITAACEKIMNANIEKLQGCINFPVASWFVEQWVAMQGATLVNNDNGRAERPTESNLDSQALIDILTWWQSMAEAGYYIYSGSQEAYTPEGLTFVSGRTAMHISTSTGIGNAETFAQSIGKFQVEFAPFPAPNEAATNGVTFSGWSLWIMNGHSEEEIRAAEDFIFFLTNPENLVRWHKIGGEYPPRQSAMTQLVGEGWFEANPNFEIAPLQVLGVTPNPANAGALLGAFPQIRQIINDTIQSVIDGGTDPTEAAQAAKQRADEAIQEYNDIIGG